MKKYLLLSARMANVLCIMLFILPFFEQCSSTRMPRVPMMGDHVVEGHEAEFIAKVLQEDSTNFAKNPFAKQVIANNPSIPAWLLVRGKQDYYTGFGMIVNGLPLFSYVGISFIFILLFLIILIRYIDRKAIKAILIIDIFIVVIMYFSQPFGFFETLWGYWVVFSTALVMLVADSSWPIYEWWQRRRQRKMG